MIFLPLGSLSGSTLLHYPRDRTLVPNCIYIEDITPQTDRALRKKWVNFTHLMILTPIFVPKNTHFVSPVDSAYES